MPRQARLDYSGALHHVIGRGIEGLHIFRTKQAKQEFLNRLKSLLKENDLQVYAWPLTSNHFHFLLQTGKTPLSEFTRKLLTGYALYYNRRHRRRGYASMIFLTAWPGFMGSAGKTSFILEQNP